MYINIVAGGPTAFIPPLGNFNIPGSLWIGVDRGTAVLLDNGIKPDAAFGDFDSVTKKELAEFETSIPDLKKYKPEKDETDMELALSWAIRQNPESIAIFGATGGRIDHFLANIHLLEKYATEGKSCEISLIDCSNYVSVKKPGAYHVEKESGKKYISFLPGSLDVSGLTLRGFKYPLENKYVPRGSTLCVSNELIDETGTFSFSEGILIVIRSND
ncbi:thiamine diphosphokinase [Neobacillus piezotolerans]|uniref:Thiamine diphosphokinase n=1 Tax=Neobacillus piezotolerans TaxID=2259171 RepID=A0A3D8GWE8_9BACI|nr:thiamine diphosphokinase [Neobacillus piezotolerans]RDU38529.1 thiamine diphosphokinase [Neobacillus piezotolerans]